MNPKRCLLWNLQAIAIAISAWVFFTQRGESASSPSDDGKDKIAQLKPAVTLPISQVILFNSGVGHFTRSGEIDGDARVDLSFPEQDINDLTRSYADCPVGSGGIGTPNVSPMAR
jgi:hypothetical protein